MLKKKGIALNQAFGAVLALVLVAVLVIIAIILFVQLGATFVNLDTTTALNESIDMTTSGGGPITLSNASLCNSGTFAITTVYNETNDVLLESGNYSVVAATGVFNNLTSEFTNNWKVTSTSNWGGASCDATQAMIVQFATYPALIGLVGTIIFLGIVIGVLVASFVFGGKDGI